MLYLLIALGVIARLVPHLPNFVPIGAIGIFATKEKGTWKSAAIVLAMMLITDLFLGFSYASIYVYAGMLLYVLWGKLTRFGWWGYLAAPVGGSLTFFMISNLGVYLGPWYTHDLAGFVKCFTLAVPFYKFTLLSDIIFTAGLFGVFYIYNKYRKGGFLWLRRLPKVISTRKL